MNIWLILIWSLKTTQRAMIQASFKKSKNNVPESMNKQENCSTYEEQKKTIFPRLDSSPD